ncbi:MAG: hypothetical protein AAGD09_06405 [Cyanobacteria bacterium P01_F01_bin.56]
MTYTSLPPQVTITTTASSQDDTLEPGKVFTLWVTITNLDSDRALDVDVALEIPQAPDVTLSSQPLRPRLALLPGHSEEITFDLKASPMALPRILTYFLKVTHPHRDDQPLETLRQQLRILPLDRTKQPIENPKFHIEPATSSTHPQPVQPLLGVPIQVWVDNRTELVDRYWLKCEGLPKDWEITITYPQEVMGPGLIAAANSLRLNPGDRGQILLTVKPPANATAGIYVPTLELTSENQPDLKLLQLSYLEVAVTYLLQPSLQSLRGQFRQGSALFELQLVNNGNSPREVELALESLDESDRYDYQLEKSRVQILSQSAQTVEIKIIPKRVWRRPLYGGGHFSNFRIRLQDVHQHPLPMDRIQGNFTWLSRPWWQLLLGILLALGVLGTAAGLIWWFLLRPPTPPKILLFDASDNSYSAANDEFAKVDFQIRHPERIKSIQLTGYNLEGKIISAPIKYDFQDAASPNELTNESLPHGLKSLCNLQPSQQLLSCSEVHTSASLPNTYVFELDVFYEHRDTDQKFSEKSSNVIIEPVPEPIIKVNQLTYSELLPASYSPNLPLELSRPIELAVEIYQPKTFQAIKLVGKTMAGDIIGEEVYPIWPFEDSEDIHPDLKNQGCQLTDAPQRITCTEFPTQIKQVGTFQLEVTLIPAEPTSAGDWVTIVTEPITVDPAPISIDLFAINGENAQPKYLIPIDQEATADSPGLQPPGVNFSWAVSGGSTMDLKLLLPDPLTINPRGTFFFPIPPGGRKTITLQATDGAGNTVERTVEIEAFDPTPTSPEDVAAAAAKATVEAMQAEESVAVPPSNQQTPFGASSSADPQGVSPSERPPQFVR